jgi:hypothetical protein
MENESNSPLDSDVHLCSVSISVGSPPSQIGFTSQAKKLLSNTLNIDTRTIRGSYAILGAGLHPLMKQGAVLRRNLSAIRDKWTIPEYGMKATSADMTSLQMCRVHNSYLIENSKVELFLEEYQIAKQQYLQWGATVTTPDNYAEIRALDAASLGKDWQIVEGKYPSREALAAAISCELPKIQPYQANFTLEDIAPEALKQLREQAMQRFQASVAGATEELLVGFQEMVENVARTCGTRVRLNPPATHPLRDRLFQAEVMGHLTMEESQELGLTLRSNETAYKIQPVVAREKGSGWKNHGEPVVYTWTLAEYGELLPYETDEYRSLHTTSFQHVLDMATKIQTVANILKTEEAGDGLLQLAEQIKAQLLALGSNPNQISSEMRKSSFARKSLKNSFQQFASSLRMQTAEYRQQQATSRRITL